jgi:hypothetical protein
LACAGVVGCARTRVPTSGSRGTKFPRYAVTARVQS